MTLSTRPSSQRDSDTDWGLERLETRVVATVVLRILGNQALHHIMGGQMMLVESVLSGTYYGWAQIMLSSLK